MSSIVEEHFSPLKTHFGFGSLNEETVGDSLML
jgi:hypothetical protein